MSGSTFKLWVYDFKREHPVLWNLFSWFIITFHPATSHGNKSSWGKIHSTQKSILEWVCCRSSLFVVVSCGCVWPRSISSANSHVRWRSSCPTINSIIGGPLVLSHLCHYCIIKFNATRLLTHSITITFIFVSPEIGNSTREGWFCFRTWTSKP